MSYKGSHYNGKLTSSEIPKLIKQDILKKYPNIDVSVNKKTFSGGWSLTVEIKDCGFNPFKTGYTGWDLEWINENQNENYINKKAEEVLSGCRQIVDSYNYDNSDIMTDYFDVGFYSHIVLLETTHILLYLRESKRAEFYNRNNPELINWVNKRLSVKKEVANERAKTSNVEVSTLDILVLKNDLKNGIEIKLNQSPSKTEKIREWLKSKGFKWSKYQALWYNKFNPILMEEVLQYFELNKYQNWKADLLKFQIQLQEL